MVYEILTPSPTTGKGMEREMNENMEMTYEETCELERNINIKNKARQIVAGFKKNVSLDLSTKKGLKFTLWSDQHNATYIEVTDKDVIFICHFLNENYSVNVNESCVFSGIANAYRGIDHLASKAGVEYNSNNYKKVK